MASQVGLTLCLLMVSSYAGVKGTDPDTTACTIAGDKIEDPDDCSNYYLCLGAEDFFPYVQSCDAAHACFDPTKTPLPDCIEDTNGDKCDDIRCPGPPPEKCIFDCSDPNTRQAAKYGDCSKYSLCVGNGASLAETCKAGDGGLYFNGEKCGTDPSVCCSCLHFETCTTAGQLLPDREDCHKYNICVGTAPDLNLVGPIACDATGIDADVCTDLALPCTPACP